MNSFRSSTRPCAHSRSDRVVAREAEALLARFANAAVNADEQRRLRAGLYRPLLAIPKDDRSPFVDLVVATLLSEGDGRATISAQFEALCVHISAHRPTRVKHACAARRT